MTGQGERDGDAAARDGDRADLDDRDDRDDRADDRRYFWPPPDGVHPAYAVARYGSTAHRAPLQPLFRAAPTLELSGPRFAAATSPPRADLTRLPGAAATAPCALGERILVAGRVTDEGGRPVRGALLELWQANAAGRYHHPGDTHDAPLDPNFHGAGRVLTDDDGAYRFLTIKPGAYPWRNHPNAWRPAHLHFSLFGESWGQRLVTQMYFPGDPLLALDPIYHAISDEAARARLVAAFALDLTEPERALGYRFDLVLRGRFATPFEAPAPSRTNP